MLGAGRSISPHLTADGDANVKARSPTSQWGGPWYSGETPTSLDDENRPRWGVLDPKDDLWGERALQHFSPKAVLENFSV